MSTLLILVYVAIGMAISLWLESFHDEKGAVPLWQWYLVAALWPLALSILTILSARAAIRKLEGRT